MIFKWTVYYLLKMDQAFSWKNRTLKNTGKMAKNTGKVREKSGNFVSPEKWEPCTLDTRVVSLVWEVSCWTCMFRRKLHRGLSSLCSPSKSSHNGRASYVIVRRQYKHSTLFVSKLLTNPCRIKSSGFIVTYCSINVTTDSSSKKYDELLWPLVS